VHDNSAHHNIQVIFMRTSHFGSILRGLRQAVLAVGLVAALPASAAQTVADIILYEQENFLGRSFTSIETIPNFNAGWTAVGRSAIVRAGSWQVCTDVYFRGRCEMLLPGQYPTLRSMRLDNRIASAREVSWQGRTRWTGRARRARTRTRQTGAARSGRALRSGRVSAGARCR
jgi:hypothetical protein